MQYEIVIADPPWNFNDGLKEMKRPVRRSAQSHYETMSPEEVRCLDVRSVVDPRWAVLALWVPSSMLKHGLEVMESWGFKFKQTFVWVKLKKDYASEIDWNNATRVGMGRLFRQSHELALIGVSGSDTYKSLKDHGQRSVAFDLNKGHSVKPDLLHARLEKMFPSSNKLELFARHARPGWTCIGSALTGKDIRESLQELASV
jgi:N6-adenosine-specific RNA methylase IME4